MDTQVAYGPKKKQTMQIINLHKLDLWIRLCCKTVLMQFGETKISLTLSALQHELLTITDKL